MVVRFPGPSFAMRNSGYPLRCASIRQVTFVSMKRSFVATKVQLAWKTLHGRTMPSGNDYYTQIYRRKLLQTEINNTILWRHIPAYHEL
ncbi:hypothetical protein DXA04_18770 [Phocaeicola vulgatus]|nr:hypothetical protein DXA04_18770 [Phocaeicola vulgatus]